MIVTCKMAQCPYYDNRGFCAKTAVVSIDEMGMCSVLWRKGQRRQLAMPFNGEAYPRESINIVDAETEAIDVIKEEDKEEAGSRQ